MVIVLDIMLELIGNRNIFRDVNDTCDRSRLKYLLRLY